MSFYATLQRSRLIQVLIVLIPMLVLYVLVSRPVYESAGEKQPPCPYVWHGGSPSHRGSCWCGAEDKYCMCTPSLAIDAVIEYHPSQETIESDISCDACSLVLVFRKDPPRSLYAIPGGFVDVGETVEAATRREVLEETNLTLHGLQQFRMYSDPARDKRRHTASMVFRCIVTDIASLRGGDDAKSVRVVPLRDVLSLSLAFDHKLILTDYIRRFHPRILDSSGDKRIPDN